MFKRKLVTAVILCGALGAAPGYAAEAPNLEMMRQFIGLMEGYYGVIDATHAIASDPTLAGLGPGRCGRVCGFINSGRGS